MNNNIVDRIVHDILNDDQIHQRIKEILGPVVYVTTGQPDSYHYNRKCSHIKKKDNVAEVRLTFLDDLGYCRCTDCSPDEQ